MKAYMYMWKYLAEFFLEWEVFQTELVAKIRAHILCSITFFQKLCWFWGNVEKYGRARQATYDNIIQCMRFACWITRATDTHSEYVILLAFVHQQWCEHTWMLHVYIHCLSCSSVCNSCITVEDYTGSIFLGFGAGLVQFLIWYLFSLTFFFWKYVRASLM